MSATPLHSTTMKPMSAFLEVQKNSISLKRSPFAEQHRQPLGISYTSVNNWPSESNSTGLSICISAERTVREFVLDDCEPAVGLGRHQVTDQRGLARSQKPGHQHDLLFVHSKGIGSG